MSVIPHFRSNYPLQQGLPLSSSDNNVVSTCLYKPLASNQDQYLDGLPSAISIAHSPRTLYAQYSDSRAISGRETGMDYRFRKDLNVLTGHDTMKSDEYFNTLPISVQSKFFSTTERTKFAQSPRSITPDSFTQDYPLQDLFSPISRQSSIYFDAENDPYPQNYDSKLLSNPKPKKSIAERRGKRLKCLNPQIKISLRTSPNTLSQMSACSLLSYQPSLLEAPRLEISTRNDQVQLATQTPKSLLKDIRENQGQEDNSFGPDHSNLTKELLSPFNDRNNFCRRQDSIIGMEIRDEDNRTNSLQAFSDSYDSHCWMEDEDDEDFSIYLDDPNSNVDWVISPTVHYTNRLSASKFMSASNKLSDRSLVSPPISNIIDSLPGTYAHHRPRAHSIATTYNTTRSTGKIYQRKISFSADPVNSLNKRNEHHRSSSHINTQSSASTLSLQSYQIVNDSCLKRKGTNPDDSSSIDNSFSLIGSNKCTKEISHLSCPQNEMSLERPSPGKSYIDTSPKSTVSPKKKDQTNQTGIIKPMVVKKIESQVSSGLNQMTLRMTLTRPDLRLDEAKIYAWQDQNLPRRQNKQVTGKGPLGGPDGWGVFEKERGVFEKERGVVKRFWNKVTHNRKVIIS